MRQLRDDQPATVPPDVWIEKASDATSMGCPLLRNRDVAVGASRSVSLRAAGRVDQDGSRLMWTESASTGLARTASMLPRVPHGPSGGRRAASAHQPHGPSLSWQCHCESVSTRKRSRDQEHRPRGARAFPWGQHGTSDSGEERRGVSRDDRRASTTTGTIATTTSSLSEWCHHDRDLLVRRSLRHRSSRRSQGA